MIFFYIKNIAFYNIYLFVDLYLPCLFLYLKKFSLSKLILIKKRFGIRILQFIGKIN